MSDINVTTPQLKEIHVHNSKNRIKESKGYIAFTIVNTIIMILVSFATLYPFRYRSHSHQSRRSSQVTTDLFPKAST